MSAGGTQVPALCGAAAPSWEERSSPGTGQTWRTSAGCGMPVPSLPPQLHSTGWEPVLTDVPRPCQLAPSRVSGARHHRKPPALRTATDPSFHRGVTQSQKAQEKNHPTRSSSCNCQGGKRPTCSKRLSNLRRCAGTTGEGPSGAQQRLLHDWGGSGSLGHALCPAAAVSLRSHPHEGDREGCCESEDHTEFDGWLYTLGEFCSTCTFYIYIRAL